MRPPGPLPVSVLRSIPFSSARRLASGLAFTLSPLSVAPAERDGSSVPPAAAAGVGALPPPAPALAGEASWIAALGPPSFFAPAGVGWVHFTTASDAWRAEGCQSV